MGCQIVSSNELSQMAIIVQIFLIRSKKSSLTWKRFLELYELEPEVASLTFKALLAAKGRRVSFKTNQFLTLMQ